MLISLSGLLNRSAEALAEADKNDYAFMLRQLLGHLEEVREDPKRLGEFFDLYT